jgi:cephalosporin hydroxylase
MAMTESIEQFHKDVNNNINRLKGDGDLRSLSTEWIKKVENYKYVYNFSWLGRPVIQVPQDIVAMQEIIWEVKPDLIIEMGIAHGGSLVMNASYLAMLDYCEAVESNEVLDPKKPKRIVLGVDIDIREHNRKEIREHPMSSRIDMLEGSSISKDIISKVTDYAKNFKKVLVILDSNHTHEHVLAELKAYGPLVTKDSFLVVFDTIIEDMPSSYYSDRPWGVGNNPKTAVWEYIDFLAQNKINALDGETLSFQIEKTLEAKLQITFAPDGFLKRI